MLTKKNNVQDISEINTRITSKITKTKKKINIFTCLFFLFLLTFSLLKVPYTGCYLDAILFEYLFGVAKYFIYTFLFLIIFLKFFRLKITKILFLKKLWISDILLIFSICILTSSISWLIGNHLSINQNFIDPLIKYHQYYFDYLNANSFSLWKESFINLNLTGGIIGEFFVSLSFIMQWAMLFIFILLLLIICLLILFGVKNFNFFKKFKKILINWMGGYVLEEKNIVDELNPEKNDKKINPIDINEIKLEADNEQHLTPPFSFLTDTSIENDPKNLIILEKNEKSLSNFLIKNGIKLKLIKIKTMPLFSEIHYESIPNDECNKIMHLKNEILNIFKIDNFIFLIKKNSIVFEFENNIQSKISIKNALSSRNISEIENKGVIGCTYESKNLFLDFIDSSFNFVLGSKGSGAIMQISALITSYVYNNSPDKLQILLCSPKEEKSFENFSGLNHLMCAPITSAKEVLEKINFVISLIEERKQKLQTNKNSTFSNVLVVIFELDQLLEISNSTETLLLKIMSSDAKKVGIKVILYSQTINSFLWTKNLDNCINSYLIFKVNTEAESEMFLKSSKATQLYGKGDGYFLDKNDNSKCRIQSCYLNKIELKQIIKIINTFYDVK